MKTIIWTGNVFENYFKGKGKFLVALLLDYSLLGKILTKNIINMLNQEFHLELGFYWGNGAILGLLFLLFCLN